MKTLDIIAERLDHTNYYLGVGYIADCPVNSEHDVIMTPNDGMVMIRCLDGCNVGEVMESIDLEIQDTFTEDISTENLLRYRILRAGRRIQDIARINDKMQQLHEDGKLTKNEIVLQSFLIGNFKAERNALDKACKEMLGFKNENKV